MVPLAIGTQTGGSVIRPASFCGVVGFKPSFGLIPRSGVLRTSRRLDTVGAFGRTIEDVALLTSLGAELPTDVWAEATVVEGRTPDLEREAEPGGLFAEMPVIPAMDSA